MTKGKENKLRQHVRKSFNNQSCHTNRNGFVFFLEPLHSKYEVWRRRQSRNPVK